MRLDWTSCSHQPPQTRRPHQIRKNHRDDLSCHAQNTWARPSSSSDDTHQCCFLGQEAPRPLKWPWAPVFSPFHHRIWPMRSYWPLVRRLKWPISWLYRRRRPNSTRTCPHQSSSKPSPAGRCPSLGAAFGKQGWVGLNMIMLKAFSDDFLHLCEIYSFSQQLFDRWYLIIVIICIKSSGELLCLKCK